MHALGRFIQERMDDEGWKPADLVRASGLSKQTVSNLLDKEKSRLGRMIEDKTLQGLVRAFPHVGEARFIAKAAEAMGLPVERMVSPPARPEDLSNRALLNLLAKRLGEGGLVWDAGKPSGSEDDGGGSRAADDLADRRLERTPDPRFNPDIHQPQAARKRRAKPTSDDPNRKK